MKHRNTNCPSCGGPVEFKTASSLVTVCDFCQTVVARTDKKVQDFGKVADIGETTSGLAVGVGGKHQGKSFQITGRVRYAHPAGGIWDEWYLAYPGDRWGWLAEAQGKFYLTKEKRLPSKLKLPDFDSLSLQSVFRYSGVDFSVREKGVAKVASAEGEIPRLFLPGAEHHFVDLSGADSQFATLEYNEQPRLFIGREVTLAELGIDLDDSLPDHNKIRVAATQLNCPQCGGVLAIQLPDQSERITCQNCDSLLDINHGKLSYFTTLQKRRVAPVIPLGSEGTLHGNRYVVIGFMERFAKYAGNIYPWTEYLLYNRGVGFRWLVCNQDHWSFVEPASTTASHASSAITLDGSTFKIYDRGTAYVRYVIGEFYWRVEVGETVRTADFIAPPRMLSFEMTKTKSSEEVVVSLGTYLSHDELQKAFNPAGVRRPWGVGPIQPAKPLNTSIFVFWVIFLVLIFMIHLANYKSSGNTGSDGELLIIAGILISLPPAAILYFRHNFEVQRWRDSDYSPYSNE